MAGNVLAGLMVSATSKPTAPSVALDGIPREMTERDQWVVWRYERRETTWTKVPHNVRTGQRASSTDPAAWASFDAATRAYQRGGWDGIGYVFEASDPFSGVDLDDCRDPETGQLEPWAAQIVADLASYTEVSPSGCGVKVLVRGKLPPGRRRKGAVEMYDTERFFAITGARLPETPATIEPRQEALEALHRRIFGEPAQPVTPSANGHTPVDLSDAQLLAKAMTAKNGTQFAKLWSGERAGYNSPSEADAALCSMLAFWTGHDAGRIDRLFRQSGLYRDKWEREDYRQKTLALALTGGESYKRRAISGVPTGTPEPEPHARQVISWVSPAAEQDSAGEPDRRVRRFALTDYGNAERLVVRHGADLRYCHPFGKWYVWNGVRWAQDTTAEVERRAKETIRAIYAEAAAEPDEHWRKALADHARRSEAKARLEAMLALAASEPGIPVEPDDLDADPWLLNVANGTLDLRTCTLREHRREDLITKLAPVAYDPNAQAPTWKAFLERILPDPKVREFVQRFQGYSLTGSTRERCLCIFHGNTGGNGKSTELDTIRRAMGDYAVSTPAETLMAKRENAIPNDLARLKGARLVVANEADEGRRIAEGLVKQLTGGADRISARFMRAEWFEFTPEFKLFLATNHRPVIRGTDQAVWDRIRLVPFNVRIPPEEQDRTLPDRLQAELPGILAWLVEGCRKWLAHGLDVPPAVREATDRYRQDMDVLAAFLADCCRLDRNAKVAASALYAEYVEWCDQNRERPLSQRKFGERLAERGLERHRGAGNRHEWLGVELLSEVTEVTLSDPNSGMSNRNISLAGLSGKRVTSGHLGHSPSDTAERPAPLPWQETVSAETQSAEPPAAPWPCVDCGAPLPPGHRYRCPDCLLRVSHA